MELTVKSKKELRKHIEEMLKDVPAGIRIKLDKEILEELLFESYCCRNEEKEILAKYIVWSGQFLSKIDLSEVSFDNVEWQLDYREAFDESYGSPIDYYEGIKKIDLSNTNANIDFSNSFQVKWFGDHATVNGIDFSNTDLSESKIDEYVLWISDSNLSNTHVKLTPKDKKNAHLDIRNSDLTGIDLSSFDVDDKNFCLGKEDEYDIFRECCLKNTKITIRKSSELLNDEAEYNLGNMLRKGYLEGCYISDDLVEHLNNQIKEEQLRLYNYLPSEKEEVSSILNSIDKQIKRNSR